MKLSPVKAVELSSNAKTGPCSATYVSQVTCPDSCPLMGCGCYANTGHVGIITARLNASRVKSQEAIANLEAAAIDTLTGRFDLRIHVVGDCKTAKSAMILSEAFARYIKRSEQYTYNPPRDIWLYTHSWREIPRECFGYHASVFASVDKPSELDKARELDYGASIIVPEFKSTKTYEIENGWKIIPCRYQTEGRQCIECRLCMREDDLKENKIAVGFEPHSVFKNATSRIALKMWEDG